MLFDRVGNLVIKRHRLIIVVWVIALLASIPFFAKAASVTSSQQGLGSPTGDSLRVEKIMNSSFSSGSSSSGGSLFLVISSDNVTSSEVRGFVEAYSTTAARNDSLANLTSVSDVYVSTSKVVAGAVSAVNSVKNGTETLAQLVFGVPSAFVGFWNGTGYSQGGIAQAEAETSTFLTSSISNSTVLAGSRLYLSAFVSDLNSSYSASPGVPVGERLQAAIETAAGQLVRLEVPTSDQAFAAEIVQDFSIENFSSPAAVESFVTNRVAQITLYTPGFAKAVYPLTSSSPVGNETAFVDELVANYSRYDLPSFYQNAITGFVSPNQKVMIVLLNFSNVGTLQVKEARDLVSSTSSAYGLQGDVQVTGDQALNEDFTQSSLGDLGIILPFTIIILIAATGIFFRSFVTPAVTLVGIGIALGIADSVILFLVGTYVIQVDPNVPEILLTVLIGVGTDYSVFLLARYREERVKGKDKFASIHKSVAWAGESIATSGLTVIISFVFLGIFQSVALLRSMGLLVGAGVLVALVASLTFIPSVILTFPNGIFWPNVGTRFARYAQSVESKIERKSGYFSKSARFAIRHAKLITVLALVATVPAVYTWYSTPVGYDFLAAAPKSLSSVQAFDSISQNFGSGTLYPTYAVVQFKAPLWNGTGYNVSEMNLVDSISNQTLSQSNVQSVHGPTRPSGERVDYTDLGTGSRATLLENAINKDISSNGTFALLDIDFVSSPQSQTSITTAQNLRGLYKTDTAENSDYLQGIYLGGAAGSTLDEKNSINGQFTQVILYVMVGVAAVLLVVLGSLFLPLFAIASIAMSISWTIATTDVVFNRLYNFPVLFITPLTLFVLLLGLGMDYNIFILTRIREEATKGESLTTSITTAVERTGGIITAAALILAGSLGTLMLSSNLLLKEFGFAFFFSIIIDAMVMRTYIVPSVMSLVGKWNWYAPGRLQRVRMKGSGQRRD
ncbi:MAG TPA: MMPL family transporter [Nitrososphaerales archaeon]|nr:MMPL family transporter [Nitrososphaerales archaeon]